MMMGLSSHFPQCFLENHIEDHATSKQVLCECLVSAETNVHVFILRFCSFFFFFLFLSPLTVNLLYRDKNHCSFTIAALFKYCSSTVHALKILKIGPMILFTHLKIILLQCFQFSVTISSIQMDPIYMCSPHCSGLRQYALLSWPVILHPHPSKHGVGMSLLVFVAKIPAQTLPTICLPLCTGAGFILLEMTKSSREGNIWTELEKAIKMSRIGVIVFSKNYAASRWCLKELAMIMECKQNLQQIVLPVFYKVDPSHLRNQNGSLKKMFATHEKRFGKHKVASWRAALIKATNLSGWDLQNIGYR